MQKRVVVSLAAIVSLGSLTLSSSPGMQAVASQPTQNWVSEETDSPQAEDTKSLANDLGVSFEEARQRLFLQEATHEVPFLELDSGFADFSTTLSPEFSISYMTTGGEASVQRVRSELESRGLAKYADYSFVKFTRAEMQEMTSRVSAHLSPETAVDALGSVADEKITVFSVEQIAMEKQAEIREEVSARVEFRISESVSSSTLGGGKDFQDCTAGFVVARESNGNLALSTAGHCSGLYSYQGNAVTWQGEAVHGHYDIEYHDNSQIT